MLRVTVRSDQLLFGEHFALSFQRTLRIPDDGQTYPLPPGLGRFPIFRVDDYRDRVPEGWAEQGGVFIPMYQREAMWISFAPVRRWQPHAVKVAVGKVNAVSGKPWSESLLPGQDDYLVVPPQPWLDGINAGEGLIRQFVAMPLGMGYTVEAQVTGREETGGLQIVVYAAHPGRFQEPLHGSGRRYKGLAFAMSAPAAAPAAGMGLAAGGRMRQKIYPDPYGIDTWDEQNRGRVFVHIVNSALHRTITGQEPPPTPIAARTYTQHGLPWFDLYDEGQGDIVAPDALKDVKSVKELDAESGSGPQQDDSSVDVPDDQIITYKAPPDSGDVRDGDW